MPIVFATIPLSHLLPDAQRIFDTTVVLVILLTLLQGPTLPWVARRLGVASASEAGEVGIETAPLDEMNAELLEVDVVAGSGLVGCYISELVLPAGADIALLVRTGKSGAPTVGTRLKPGDRLLIVATADVRLATERRLRAVSRRGPLQAGTASAAIPTDAVGYGGRHGSGAGVHR